MPAKARVLLRLTYGDPNPAHALELTITRPSSDQRDASTSVTFHSAEAIAEVIRQMDEVKGLLIQFGLLREAAGDAEDWPDAPREDER